jgi:hypothetical protein
MGQCAQQVACGNVIGSGTSRCTCSFEQHTFHSLPLACRSLNCHRLVFVYVNIYQQAKIVGTMMLATNVGFVDKYKDYQFEGNILDLHIEVK